MRRLMPCLAIALVTMICQGGGLKISRTTFRGKDADKAQEAALKGYKPIAIVYSDPESKDDDVIKTTKNTMSALKSSTILIFVDSTDVNELPQDALKIIQSSQTGKKLPRTVILKPNLYSIVGILPATYERKDFSKLMTIAKKRISAVSKKIREDEVARKIKLQKARREAEKLLRQ